MTGAQHACYAQVWCSRLDKWTQPQLDDNAYWLALSLVPGIGSKRILQLRSHFGDLEAAWHASESDLTAAGLSRPMCQNLAQHRQRIDLAAELRKVEQAGAWLLTLDDPRYPHLLREIDDAPALLYIRGDLLPEDRRALAVVGTRKPSRYGIDVAHELSRDLAARGVAIVSGLAAGIDAAAHEGALRANGRTLAVMGCGVDIVYPSQNGALYQRIAQSGAIVSEFPIGTKPNASNFPRRNRLISGLTLGTLIVEAPESSGALITASLAADQGREVFAVPSSIHSPSGRGTNKLIQDGAKLVTCAQDILDEFDIAFTHAEVRTQAHELAPTSGIEAQVMQYLETEPVHIDEIVRLSGLSTPQVSSALTLLELKGLAQTAGPMQYCRTYPQR